jgi:radical SAM protein with 4Fe4S-binding SPASM domain
MDEKLILQATAPASDTADQSPHMPFDAVIPGNSNENRALNIQEKTRGDIRLVSRPIRVSMNMTGKCNIRCIYCHLTFADYFTKDELERKTFEALSGFFPTLSHLVYFASTEPLMARHFKGIFEASGPSKAEKYLSTNGILMTEDIAELFVKGDLYYLTISIAGLTRESFKKAHQVDDLDKVTANIETLNRIKEKYNSITPKMRLVFVTWKENAHELVEAVRYAHRHKFSEGIKITYLKAYTDDLIDQIPYDNLEEVQKWVREAQRLGKELGVPVAFDGGNFDDFDDEIVGGEHRPCHEPWERMHIEADGTVRTCASNLNTIVAGDLKTQTAEEIWNGPVYTDFRERVNTANPPDPCRRCTHNFHKDFRRRDIWDQRDLDLGIFERLPAGKSYLKSRHQKKK